MPKYLIDANLPYRFSVWNTPDYIHQKDIDDQWTDEQIWQYAKNENLTIVTKDADFLNKMILSEPPPRIIHIRFGNMRMNMFFTFVKNIWDNVTQLSTENKIVSVYKDRIETIN